MYPVGLNTNFQQVGWLLRLLEGSVSREGADFPVAESELLADPLTFSFVGRGQPQPVAEAQRKFGRNCWSAARTWGLSAITSAAAKGAQEQISARIRYDFELAIAKEFTDDLGRRWFATSTHTEGRRRWLVIEGIRLVAGIDLPEFGANA